MQLPQALTRPDDTYARDLLECYYGRGRHAAHHPFTGSWFDTWDSTGTRTHDHYRFTADDLVAVGFLSVSVSSLAAKRLLDEDSETFAALLRELGPDRDLAHENIRWPDDWVGWRLWQELNALPDVGPTIASKLYARKRPRLRPIYASVVAEVLRSKNIWEPLRAELQRDVGLHARLLTLRDKVGLPAEVSALRVFDVLVWMEGTYGQDCPGARLG